MATGALKFPLQIEQFELRPYQVDAVAGLRAEVMACNSRVLLQAGTGSGKTVVAAEVIKRAVAKGSRVLFLAHRRELIDQCSDKLFRFGVQHGIIMAGRRLDLAEQVQVASIQTLWSRRESMDLPSADLIVIDECHRSMSRTYREIVEDYPKAVLLGLTATPCRTDGKGLGHMYDAMYCCPSIAELTEQGYLVPPRYFAPTQPDLSGVDVATSGFNAGDYVQTQLGSAMDKAELVGDVVEQWQKFGEDRPTVVFASSVAHSQHLAESFQKAGIAAAHLDGETPKDEREHLLADLTQGRLQVLSNCEVLCEGWDCPIVSCIVLAKPTKSIGRYLQMAGRGMRPAPGKEDCLILDHAGAIIELWPYSLLHVPIEWSLDVKGKVQDRPPKALGELPVFCSACQKSYKASRKNCPYCGEETPRKIQQALAVPDPTPGELAELRCLDAGIDAERVRWFRQLKGYAKERGYHWKWVDYSYRDQFGDLPHSSLRGLPAASPGPEVKAWISKRLKEFAEKQQVSEAEGDDHESCQVHLGGDDAMAGASRSVPASGSNGDDVMRVVKFWPQPGKRVRKDHECCICRHTIRKGLTHYNVTLDGGGEYPEKRKACYGCWQDGKLKNGAEVSA